MVFGAARVYTFTVPGPKWKSWLRLILVSLTLLTAACRHPADVGDTNPLTPEQALQSFEVAEGFRIVLFAAEPHVVDPVDMAFDENGGIWVAELLDYPWVKEGEPPRSHIKFLEDTDADGVIDKHTVFADQLNQVSSVLPWKDGLLAAVPPDILFFRDLDGDHVADERKVMHTGFTQLFPQRQINNLRHGLDNWIYVANRGQPGEITSPDRPDQPPAYVRGLDFRFRPDRELFEPETGNTQFGVSFDEWGNRFLSENTTHLRHAVIPYRYLARNPFVNATIRQEEISDHGSRIFPLTPPQQWRVERTAVRRERYRETNPSRDEQLEGHFTASCGATVYLGDAFPEDYVGNVFVSDTNGNLIHCDVLKPKGATFTASRKPADREFVASTDNWFRPVNFKNAPDGNLYVLDYYRQYIEHSNFVPDSVQQRLKMDFYNGDDRGRIYRIVPEEARNNRTLNVSLGSASTAELVQELAGLNGWRRRTAQRLLVDRQDESAVPLLEAMARQRPSPQARLHALWTLEGMSVLKADLVELALNDPHPGVRENAVRLAELFMSDLASAVIERANDESDKVQYQVALTLGNLTGSRDALQALADITKRHAEDPWFRLAATSAPQATAPRLLTLIERDKDFPAKTSDGKTLLVRELSRVVGAGRSYSEVEALLVNLAGDPSSQGAQWKEASLLGLAAGLQLEGKLDRSSSQSEKALTTLLTSEEPQVQLAAREAAQFFELRAFLARALAEAADDALPTEQRVAAIRSLRGGSFAAVEPIVREILTSPVEQDLQIAAAESAAAFDHPDIADLLLAGWGGYAPATRQHVVAGILTHTQRTSALLSAVEQESIAPNSIEAITRIRLAQHPDAELSARASKIFAVESGDRSAVVAQHEDVLRLAADAARGKEVFERECSKCHLRTAERGRIGPDLSGVSNQSEEALLAGILDPSANIEGRFTNYLVTTTDGRLHDGLLVGETSATVTIRGELEDTTLLRKNVEEIRASIVSLMPEGLEETLTRQEIADVIAYLRAGL